MKHYAGSGLKATTAKLGYNPMLEEFSNTSFFVSDIPSTHPSS